MLRRVFLPVLNFIAPPTCASCSTALAARPSTPMDAALCGDCFADLDFWMGPKCRRCATRIDGIFSSTDLVCGRCLSDPPSFTQTHAPFVYGGTARQLILAHKHGGQRTNAPLLAHHMAQSLPAPLENCVLVPVPLHRSRLRQRGFNQALDLARAVSQKTHIPVHVQALARVRPTPSQGTMSARARARNMAGAFEVRMPQALKGKTVILVDDVMTSGATVQALAKVILRAGSVSVQVLAAARALPK